MSKKATPFTGLNKLLVTPIKKETKTEPERLHRSTEPNARTERSNRSTERNTSAVSEDNVLLELKEGTQATDRKPTQRYSFEIYRDQIRAIEALQFHYKQKTGKKLSASRLLREALTEYLKKAHKTLEEEGGKPNG